ncbi:MAG: enoyl-CoA hydratase/isomerase family protein [Halomonadaceae bacterium]|nr:MAG: enoyl-CoA hydratase/isomerase family protein [Halomonadaceae bacterium]
MTALPQCDTLALQLDQGVLHITLNRPDSRNAMSLLMVQELRELIQLTATDDAVRALVLRGAGGHFCAGGDLRDMVTARGQKAGDGEDPFYTLNRAFGHLLLEVEQCPQTVVAVLEGAVMGGGFGLACVADISLTRADARFALPETSLGIPPAQIAPFVVRRIGLTQARRLALLGERFDGCEALSMGVAQFMAEDEESMEQQLGHILQRIRHCAPGASRVTKALLLRVGNEPLAGLLDDAAGDFARAIRGAEGQEGTTAFMQKRPPQWAKTDANDQ